jgi:hypothetical protein
MNIIRLPFCQVEVRLRPPTGADDLLLLEAPACDTELALALLSRLAEPVTEDAFAWDTLSVTDLEALLLRLRQHVFGDRLCADVICPGPECGARVDVEFSLNDYLDHHRPWKPRGIEFAGEVGWYRLRDTLVLFRPPTGADQVAVARTEQPERALIHRCVRPTDQPSRLLRRVEKALEALNPRLSRDLQGVCPECGAEVVLDFDVPQFVLGELRYHAAFIYEEVHLLASRYHWSEEAILALPRSRRRQYAEQARTEGRRP